MSQGVGYLRTNKQSVLLAFLLPAALFISAGVYMYQCMQTQHMISQSITASQALSKVLTDAERNLEKLEAADNNEHIQFLQRQLITLVNEASYLLNEHYLITDSSQTSLSLLREVGQLPTEQVSRYLATPVNLAPLLTSLQTKEAALVKQLAESTRQLETLLITTALLLTLSIGFWCYLLFSALANGKGVKDTPVTNKVTRGLESGEREFLSLMSHEFRAPISAIITALELIPNMPNQQQKLIQQAEQSCYRLLNLTNNLLDIMSDDNDHQQFISNVDLISLLDECISPYSVEVKDKKIEFTMHCHESVPQFIEGDANNIAKAIKNVMDNAVKFTTNGSIKVGITTQVTRKKIFLVINITDSGLGIDENIKLKIFERFFRGDQALNDRYPGAGIGLSVVKKSLDRLDGEIRFTSQVGQGSEFTLSIPIKPISSSSPAPVQPKSAQFAVVDDLEISRIHLKNIITNEGFVASCFASGSDLLALHDDVLAYSAIFVDLYMPGINGLELIRTLHAIYGKRTPPIIVLSATPDIANVIANSQLDVWQSFVKPVDRNRIIDSLHHLALPKLALFQATINARVLIVEDEPINAEMLENMLICMGHTPKTVRSGEAAIIEVSDTSYDTVLLDINLPDINGLEVASIIREKKPELPVIAVTANAYRSDKEASKRAGIRYHLVKPVTFQELKNTLKLTLLKFD